MADVRETRRRPGVRVQQLLTKAKKAQHRGKPHDCIAACRRILEEQPGHPKALGLLGLSALQLGDFQTGIGALRQAVEVDPGHIKAFVNLGKAFVHTGNPAEAEKAFRGALAADPGDVEANLNYAISLETGERFIEAKEHYLLVTKKRPRLAQAWLGLGNTQKAAGDFSAAKESFTRAADLQPDYASAHHNLGSVLLNLDEYEAAADAFRTTIDLDAGRADSWYNLGSVLQKAGQLDDSVNAFEKAHDLSPDDFNTIINLGMAYQKVDKLSAAVSAYEKAQALNPDSFESYTSLVSAYIQADDLEAAEGVCDGFLSSHPASSALLSCKAIVLNEMGRSADCDAIVDFDRFIRKITLVAPSDYRDMDDFNQALSDHVTGHPSLEYSTNATRHGLHSKELQDDEKGPIAELEKQILVAVEDYRGSLGSDPAHQFVAHGPAPDDRYKINIWAVIMQRLGYQIPHIHPGAWLSGVYYPKIPSSLGADENNKDGWIEFGRPSDEYPCKKEPRCRTFLPVEGNMFLFPSFMYHRTIPLETDETRISIAFDIVLQS